MSRPTIVVEHGHFEGIPTASVALLAGICSALLGFVSFATNSVLLWTLFKDPYMYFRVRPTTFLVASLSLSDLLGGSFAQPLYSTYMLCLPCKVNLPSLHKISTVSSHISTKISISTVVALSVDRFLAIKLIWKYRALITVRKVVICNILIWLFCGVFEAWHSISTSKEILHTVDLHLQSTAPLRYQRSDLHWIPPIFKKRHVPATGQWRKIARFCSEHPSGKKDRFDNYPDHNRVVFINYTLPNCY